MKTSSRARPGAPWVLLTFLLALGASGCASRSRPAPAAPQGVANATDPGADLSALDRRVEPCQDFYRFACGGWIDKTTIPPDRPAWSRSFSEIQDRNLTRLRAILDGYAAGQSTEQPYAQKLGDFYAACLDEPKAETASLATLKRELARVDRLTNTISLPALLADWHLSGVDALFAFGAMQDFKDARQMIGAADQGGLGLPDRDYYLKDDAKSVEVRKGYLEHVTRMLSLAGVSAQAAAAAAKDVLAFETELARASMSRTERRNPEAIYNRLDRPGLEKVAPAVRWDAYFQALGKPDVHAINVLTPQFFARLNQLVTATPLPTLRAYLRWRMVDAAAPALGKAFVDESFRFGAQHLTGEEQLLPRWKRCIAAVEAGMPQALARPFVANTFGAQGKAEAQGLVKQVEAAFARNLDDLVWMDEATRAQAREKLERLYNKIGYPAVWRRYDDLAIDRESDLANRMRAASFEGRRDLNKIGKPVDREEWHMPPHMVNAYYDASLNEMVFPAGILQPPFFASDARPAVNYGGIGMVMGHELTHGFDDEGRKFDAFGNLRDWWTPDAARQFESRAQCVVDQYAQYTVGDLRLDGRLTAGENIADIGGLKLAHAAFKSAAKDADRAGPDAFTPEQRFFIAFAQSWCTKRRDPYARMLVTVDPHAPPEYRVNGPVSALPAFQQAFGCQTGAPMAPARRCAVW